MEYDRIPVVLKRYTFDSKMQACTVASMKTIDLMGTVSPEVLRTLILPWDLETFVLFAVKAIEYNNADIRDKNGKCFFEVMHAIYKHQSLDKLHEGDDFICKLIIHSGLTQFDLQERQEYKYYRYHYFFGFSNNEIDMAHIFKQKFGLSYERVWQLGAVINVLFSTQKATPDILQYIVKKFSDVLPLLCISREEYANQIDTFASGTKDYPFCVRPSYSYPFISDGNVVYLPLPHLVYRATTASLLFRLTEGNNALRDSIGKNVLEQYLFDILSASKAYDEVLPEGKYTCNRRESRTPDVQIRSGNDYLFFESKAAVPPNTVRNLDNDAIVAHVERIAGMLYQLFKQIRKFRTGYFYPFANQKPQGISTDNLWGIVCLLEDSFVSRERVYMRFAQQADLQIDSAEYKWVVAHIKVISLYDIEKNAFIGHNIIQELQAVIDKDGPFDFALSDCAAGTIVNAELRQFRSRIGDVAEEISIQMQHDGIIS